MNTDTIGRHLGHLAAGLGWIVAAFIIVALVAASVAYAPLAVLIACVLFVAWGLGWAIHVEQEDTRREAAARAAFRLGLPPPPPPDE